MNNEERVKREYIEKYHDAIKHYLRILPTLV